MRRRLCVRVGDSDGRVVCLPELLPAPLAVPLGVGAVAHDAAVASITSASAPVLPARPWPRRPRRRTRCARYVWDEEGAGADQSAMVDGDGTDPPGFSDPCPPTRRDSTRRFSRMSSTVRCCSGSRAHISACRRIICRWNQLASAINESSSARQISTSISTGSITLACHVPEARAKLARHDRSPESAPRRPLSAVAPGTAFGSSRSGSWVLGRFWGVGARQPVTACRSTPCSAQQSGPRWWPGRGTIGRAGSPPCWCSPSNAREGRYDFVEGVGRGLGARRVVWAGQRRLAKRERRRRRLWVPKTRSARASIDCRLARSAALGGDAAQNSLVWS